MKETFAAKTFASKTFASGMWTGIGVFVAVPLDGNFSFTDDLRPFVNDNFQETPRPRRDECQ